MINVRLPLYSPIDLGGVIPASSNSPLTSDSILNALESDDNSSDSDESTDDNSEDDKIVPDFNLKLDSEDESDDEDDEAESDDEDESKSKKSEDEEEETEFKLDDEDEVELANIPKRAELKKAYPDIFKKFPALDHIIHREHAFAEIFPTVNDAKQAKDSLQSFSKIQGELLDGDISGVLQSIKSENPKSYSKIADNILETLIKTDPSSHLTVTQKVSKSVLKYIHDSSSAALKRNPDDKNAGQLQIASELIHEALYGTAEVTPFQSAKQEKTEDPEREEFIKEKTNFENQRFTSAFQTVADNTKTVLTRAVERDIDSKNILPPYVKTRVVEDVMTELDRQLSSDTRFRGIVGQLWSKAKESNYSDESLNKIKTALRNKAKTILPGIMRAKRGEAMKGLSGIKPKEQPRMIKREDRAPRDNNPKLTRSKTEDRNVPREGESIRDFLMRD